MSMTPHDDDAPLRALIKEAMPPLVAPTELRRIVSADIGRARTVDRWPRSSTWSIAAAVLVMLGGGSWLLGVAHGRRVEASQLTAQTVVANHLRSLVANHLTDVASTDRHTVKPWFAGKLDYAPPVVDLSAQGFPLVGGRIDYLGTHRVAALVYSRAAHTINVFVWPDANAPGIDVAPAQVPVDGYSVVHWSAHGMIYWAVSDTDTATLQQFAELLRR